MKHSRFVVIALSLGAMGVALATFRQGSGPILPQPVYSIPADLSGWEGFSFVRSGLSSHLRQSFDFNRGETAMLFRWGELSPTSNDPEAFSVSEITESTTYAITAVATRSGGSVAYVAGITQSGSDVIELWNYPVRAGGYGIRTTSGPTQPIGTPMPPYTAEEYLNGSTFIAPGSSHTPARRIPMYAGSAIGHIRYMAADPEGRFLMILSYPSGSVYRLDVGSTNSTPTLVYSSSTIPALATAKTLQVMQHIHDGRKYVLTERAGCVLPETAPYTVLSDTNNDGVMDSWATLSGAEWDAAGYEDDANWVDLQNLGVVFNW